MSPKTVLEVHAPYDGALIAELEAVDEAGIDAAFETAVRLHRDRDAWLPVHERVAILERTAELLAGRAEELALVAAREGGKPLLDSRVEVARAIDGVKLCVQALRTSHGTEVPMNNAAARGRLAFTRLEPIGPVAAISAFNHPLNLIVHQAGPAVAAGCPVIVKPAETTPLSAVRFVEILHEAGLPPGWCQLLVTGDLALAERFATDPRVAFLTFIGSYRVGWMLRSKLAPGARCSLENGGIAPVIVAADADLDDVVPLLVKGGFYHAGQVCVSVQRVFAERSIARDVATRMAEQASALRVGDPTSPDTEVGPLIRHRDVDRVEEWVAEAVSGGAEVLCGGERISASCYQPTVLFDPPKDARVSTAEIFGPVVCVYPINSLDEGIQRANDTPFAFQAAVCTRNLDTALRVSRRLDASLVAVNDHTAFRVDWMPFGGLRQSGLGTGGIEFSLRDMQIEKQIVIRSREL